MRVAISGCLRCVRTDDEKAIGVRLEFGDRIRHGAAPKGCGQTGHSGSVSETGAVIDVIRADHRAGKLLQQVVFFIGAFGEDRMPMLSGPLSALIWPSFSATSVRASSQVASTNVHFCGSRVRQAVFVVDKGMHVPAFDAQAALADNVILGGQHADQFVVQYLQVAWRSPCRSRDRWSEHFVFDHGHPP
jgi:hypothetical protein